MSKPKRHFDILVDDLHWGALYDQHMHDLRSLNAISTLWNQGFAKLGLTNKKLPVASELTAALQPYTGYTFIQTESHLILPQRQWYGMIADYKMPLTCFIRRPSELSYCDEPDIWHDIMGHIPFLIDHDYSEMYQLLAYTYIEAHDAQRIDILKQLDFVSGILIELALVREDKDLKALGATLYSSSEVFEAFDSNNQREFIMSDLTSGETYDRHGFQGKYFIVDSLAQLTTIIQWIRRLL